LNAFLSPGNERYDLLVTPQQGNSEPVVQDLAQLVEEATGVPLPFQKLIFKGKWFSFIFEYLWLKDLLYLLGFFFLHDKVPLCSPGCPRTHYIDQAGLELTGILLRIRRLSAGIKVPSRQGQILKLPGLP
jgi:hypothetical protein